MVTVINPSPFSPPQTLDDNSISYNTAVASFERLACVDLQWATHTFP